jgi:hypothetical protein
MTNGQDQGDGMPPADNGQTETVISITWGRLCWTPPPGLRSGPPMKVTVTVETGGGSFAASSDLVERMEALDHQDPV